MPTRANIFSFDNYSSSSINSTTFVVILKLTVVKLANVFYLLIFNLVGCCRVELLHPASHHNQQSRIGTRSLAIIDCPLLLSTFHPCIVLEFALKNLQKRQCGALELRNSHSGFEAESVLQYYRHSQEAYKLEAPGSWLELARSVKQALFSCA